jgi:hypothetical protein
MYHLLMFNYWAFFNKVFRISSNKKNQEKYKETTDFI